jgi:hypothetical protein
MDTFKIIYEFYFPDETRKTYVVELDKKTITQLSLPNALPDWTKLENKKCSHCPLNEKDSPHCPVAASLSDIVEAFKDKISFSEVAVKVTTAERTYAKKVPLQDGIFGIFGLVMATSGCPHMDFLKPMARFHMPFSTAEETIVRSVSTYLLRQYFVKKRGGNPDFDLKNLEKLYNNIQTVNMGILARIRAIAKGDADVNAVTILHSFAQLLNMAISKDLSKIEGLFQ